MFRNFNLTLEAFLLPHLLVLVLLLELVVVVGASLLDAAVVFLEFDQAVVGRTCFLVLLGLVDLECKL